MKDKINELVLGFADLIKGIENTLTDLERENSELRGQIHGLKLAIQELTHHSEPTKLPEKNEILIQNQVFDSRPEKTKKQENRKCICGNVFTVQRGARTTRCKECYRKFCSERMKLRYEKKKLDLKFN